MEADALRQLRKTYPELEEHVLEEALRNSDWDVQRATDALRVSERFIP